MKLSILLDIFFQLLRERKITATELAEKYGFSARTAYRYVDILAKTLPLRIKRGRNGGAYLSDCYKLPAEFLTAEEYEAAIDALTEAYAKTAEERFLNARRKLSAQDKSDKRRAIFSGDVGDVFICDGENSALSNTLLTLQECMQERTVVNIRITENGKATEHRAEPHALIFDGKAWRLYAFFHTDRSFRLAFISDTVGVFRTESNFRRRSFKKADVLKLL